MSRKTARENLFKLVYEFVSTEKMNQLSLQTLTAGMSENDLSYVENLYIGIISKYDELIKLIDECAVDFSVSRIFRVDLSIMLVSAYEILYCEDIPFQVSINEALEICKIYSTEKSTSFINGVLSKIITSTKESV